MKKYNGCKTLRTVVCNCCGRTILVERGIAKEDYMTVCKEWGYFSEKDEEVHELDLCEECYNNWIQTFALPVEVHRKKELV